MVLVVEEVVVKDWQNIVAHSLRLRLDNTKENLLLGDMVLLTFRLNIGFELVTDKLMFRLQFHRRRQLVAEAGCNQKCNRNQRE